MHTSRWRKQIGHRRRAAGSNPKRQSVGTAGGGPKYDIHGRRIDPPAPKSSEQKGEDKDSNEKPKYSEVARENGWADLELIDSIERDIVEHKVDVKFESIAGHETAKQLLQETVLLPFWMPDFFTGIRRPWKGNCGCWRELLQVTCLVDTVRLACRGAVVWSAWHRQDDAGESRRLGVQHDVFQRVCFHPLVQVQGRFREDGAHFVRHGAVLRAEHNFL